MVEDFYEKALDDFKEATKHPPDFLLATPKLSSTIESNLKWLYDFSQSQEQSATKQTKSNVLPQLIVKNLDTEQIWQQIELQNNDTLSRCVPKISRFVAGKTDLVFDVNVFNKEVEKEQKESDLENENDAAESASGEEPTDDKDDLSENDHISENEDEEPTYTTNENKKIVDDKFFKLSEMEEFLKNEEKKVDGSNNKKRKNVGGDSEDESENSDDESIDYFEEDKESEDGTEEEDAAKMARFKDYFVQKDETAKQFKNKSFLSDDKEPSEDDLEPTKSSLELRQERLSRKIEELEEEAVSNKPWQLKGEITAESRPPNSLLAEVLEFDMTSKPAPIITEQTSLQLEDIIRQRIKDKVFDSVERKIKPVETPLEYRKKLVLDQEKSKESLAQIYEKEYLDQQAALDPDNQDKEKEPELHKEIKNLMRTLFNKLDALSNFHFTSKPAIPDLKIVSNLPAVSMEEVAPVAVSDATLLAPEEVKRKGKGDIIGKSEKTKADKNRERRKKKLKQKIHAKEKTKRETLKNKSKNVGVPVKYAAKKQKLRKG